MWPPTRGAFPPPLPKNRAINDKKRSRDYVDVNEADVNDADAAAVAVAVAAAAIAVIDVEVEADAHAMRVAGVPFGGALATDVLLNAFLPPALHFVVADADIAAIRSFDRRASLIVANIVQRFDRKLFFPTTKEVLQLCTITHLVRMRVLEARTRPITRLMADMCATISKNLRTALSRVGSAHFPCPLAVSTVLWQLVRVARLVALVLDAHFTASHYIRMRQPLGDVLGWLPLALPDAAASVTLRDIAGLICRPARACKAPFPLPRNIKAFVRKEVAAFVPPYLRDIGREIRDIGREIRDVGREIDGAVAGAGAVDVLGPVLDATQEIERAWVSTKEVCDARDVRKDPWDGSLDVLPHDINEIVGDVFARLVHTAAQPAPCKDELLMQYIGDAIALQQFLLAMEYCVITYSHRARARAHARDSGSACAS